LQRLSESGCHLLNQSVLLKGINDCPDTLEQLSENLFEHGVLPYYLHLLDHATGTAHFEVGVEEAMNLMNELRCRLPGYLVPRLVREEQGVPYKTPIASNQ
ncbi:MAG: EF-P beta-lysylation protein EpmB, partial [Methylococcaceae bacterium]